MNHEEFFKTLAINGCPKCKDVDGIEIQRRIEEQINYDEYWNIDGNGFELNDKEDYSRIKKVIWYVVKCNECDYENSVDNLDLLVEVQQDHDGKNITEESFSKEIQID